MVSRQSPCLAKGTVMTTGKSSKKRLIISSKSVKNAIKSFYLLLGSKCVGVCENTLSKVFINSECNIIINYILGLYIFSIG